MSISIFHDSKACKICQAPNPPDKHFWTAHKIKIKDYYEAHFPKTNLLTGAKLEFKSIENYLQNDFADKNELREWIKNNNKDVVLEYLKSWLSLRREIKGIEYALGQFDARSLLFPSVSFIIKSYGLQAWEKINKEIGLKLKYDHITQIKTDYLNELNFIVDSREQSVLNVPNKQIKKLDVGDYALDDPDNKLFIERKSLNDFIGTMSAGYDRFDRELQRCQDAGAYLIILIEEKYANILSYNCLPHMRNVKATPIFIASRFRSLIQKYPLTCQFLAVDGRKEAIRVIEKIYRVKDIQNLDLQYLYDTSLF